MMSWVSDRVSHFAHIAVQHVFPHKEFGFEHSTLNLASYRSLVKNVTLMLRHVFYNARQLELDGIPIAHGIGFLFFS